MRKIALAFAILGTALTTALYTAPAHAQATRTWVSGVGDDANPCSRTAPCKTFAGAISKTAPGGEIDALDPGGFGALTITKSITIDGGGGQVASVLVAGTNGIVVAAQSTDIVILRNLRFDGLLGGGNANAGINGIRFISGAELVVDNCDVFGFTNNGLDVALGATGFAEVRNSTFRNNGANGVGATTTSGGAIVQIYNSSIFGGGSANTQGGINAGSNAFVVVQNTNFENLKYGARIQDSTNGALSVDNSVFSGVLAGIVVPSGSSANGSNNSFYSGSALSGSQGAGGTGTVNTANNNKIGSPGTVGGATVNSSGVSVK
jgi:hypothetical protein